MAEIDEELLAKLYAMPEPRSGMAKLNPTERQLKILMELWPIRKKMLVAKALGVSTGVARRWYNEEIEKRKAKT